MAVALRLKRQLLGLKMGSQHLPSFTFYAILDPLVRPSQSIVGCTALKVERTARARVWGCVRVCSRARACVASDVRDLHCQKASFFISVICIEGW